MPIQRPATTTATGRRTRHIAAAADQSCRASSFAVAAMIRSARAFEASRLAVIVAEASPATCSTAFSTRSSVRFSIRWTAPPTWLTSFWFAVTCAFRPSIAEAAPLHEQYPTQLTPGTPLPILPYSEGLRRRIWYGAGSNASAIQVARDGVVVPGAWAAGDCAAVPDLTSEDPQATCAPTAQHAVRQAAILADNLVTVLTGPAEGDGSSGQGEQRLAVYAHENLGTVASLGIGKGVARIMGQNLRGFTAWTAHRGYHVYAMPTLNRKVRIMMDWFAAVVFRRDLASFGSVAAPGAAFAQATRNDAKIASRKKS